MTEEERKRWEEVITSTNMTHNSRKAWTTIRKLSNDPTTSNHPCLFSANQVVHQVLINGRGTMPSKPKRNILSPATEGDYSMVYPFSEEEYRKGVAILTNDKAAGRGDVTEVWKGLCDSKELQTNIPLVSYVQTLRNNDTEQNNTNHRTAPS